MPRDHLPPQISITREPNVQVVAASARHVAAKVRDGLAAVAEWEAEHGAFTVAELKAARRRLAISRSRRTVVTRR